MDLDDGGVDHGVFHVGIVGHGVEQSLPGTGLRPVAEGREYVVPGAQQGREIPPRAAGSGDPQARLNKSSVVLAAAAGVAPLAKTKRLHLRPLGVSQNESVHSKLESQSSTDENPKFQQALDGGFHLTFFLLTGPRPPLANAPFMITGREQARVLELLRRPSGATIATIMESTGWQSHSVRGFFAGVVRKKLRLNLVSEKTDGGRVYRIAKGKPGAIEPLIGFTGQLGLRAAP